MEDADDNESAGGDESVDELAEEKDRNKKKWHGAFETSLYHSGTHHYQTVITPFCHSEHECVRFIALWRYDHNELFSNHYDQPPRKWVPMRFWKQVTQMRRAGESSSFTYNSVNKEEVSEKTREKLARYGGWTFQLLDDLLWVAGFRLAWTVIKCAQ